MATLTTCWLLLSYVVFWQSYMTSNWTSLGFKQFFVFLILQTKLLIGELKHQMPDLSIYHNTNKNDTNTVVCKKTKTTWNEKYVWLIGKASRWLCEYSVFVCLLCWVTGEWATQLEAEQKWYMPRCTGSRPLSPLARLCATCFCVQ